jgi:hypothetical protein
MDSAFLTGSHKHCTVTAIRLTVVSTNPCLSKACQPPLARLPAWLLYGFTPALSHPSILSRIPENDCRAGLLVVVRSPWPAARADRPGGVLMAQLTARLKWVCREPH